MRTFSLIRNEDETGISGTGVVAQGVVFEDGTVAMRWLTETASTALYDNIIDLEKIHGHNGKTVIVWETTYRFRDGVNLDDEVSAPYASPIDFGFSL